MAERSKRDNIYFRKTERQFEADHLNQVYEHFNKNLPYRIYRFSKRQFRLQISRLKSAFNKIATSVPKGAKKVKSVKV